MRSNTLRKRALLVVAGLASCSAVATHASAALIDAEFNPGGNTVQSGAAVLGAAGDGWNNLAAASATGAALSDTTGAATGVTVSYAEAFGGSDAGGSAMDAATTNLMEGFGSFNGSTITLAGLTPNTAYEIVLFGAGDQNSLNGASNGGQGTTFTIPQTGPSLVGLTTEVNPINPLLGDRMISDGPGVAYTVLNPISSATGALNVNVTYNSTSFSTAPVNGFQLLTPSVPEPMSLSVLGLGSIAFLGRRRRSAMPA